MPGNLGPIPGPDIIETWPTPDYAHPRQQRTWIAPFSIVLLIITTVMVSLRFYVRIRQQAGPFGLDDWFLLPGYLLSIPFTAFLCLGVYDYGFDRHVYDAAPWQWPKAALMAWLGILFFLVATTCTKVSALLFFRRLSDGIISPKWKYACAAAIWFTIIYCLVFVLLLIFECNPIEAYWEAYNLNYHLPYYCLDTRAANVSVGVLSTVSDLYAVLLPIGMLRQFDAPRRQKIALNVVFSLGILMVVCGAIRTYYLHKVGISWDATWTGYDVFLWGDIEMQLANITASAPALRVFFGRFFNGAVGRSTMRSGGVETGPYGDHFSAHGGPASRAMISYTSLNSGPDHHHTREGSYDDKPLARHPAQISHDSVEEYQPRPPPPASAQAAPYPIKTPADFEAFALQELEKTRKSPYQHEQIQYDPNMESQTQRHHEYYAAKALPAEPDTSAPEVVPDHYQRHFHDNELKRPQSMKATISGPYEDPFTNPYPS